MDGNACSAPGTDDWPLTEASACAVADRTVEGDVRVSRHVVRIRADEPVDDLALVVGAAAHPNAYGHELGVGEGQLQR